MSFFLKFKSEFKVKLKTNKHLNLELKLIDIFVVFKLKQLDFNLEI